jgi:hypothetical protein
MWSPPAPEMMNTADMELEQAILSELGLNVSDMAAPRTPSPFTTEQERQDFEELFGGWY